MTQLAALLNPQPWGLRQGNWTSRTKLAAFVDSPCLCLYDSHMCYRWLPARQISCKTGFQSQMDGFFSFMCCEQIQADIKELGFYGYGGWLDGWNWGLLILLVMLSRPCSGIHINPNPLDNMCSKLQDACLCCIALRLWGPRGDSRRCTLNP